MEYYSAEKESELLIQTTQVNLSCSMLSERSHILKKKEKKNLYGNLRWLYLKKQRLKGGSTLFGGLWSPQPSRGPAAELRAGKKGQYAKSAEDSGQTRPSAPSIPCNPTAESSDQLQQQFTAAAQDSSLLLSAQPMLVQLTSPELELCLDSTL